VELAKSRTEVCDGHGWSMPPDLRLPRPRADLHKLVAQESQSHSDVVRQFRRLVEHIPGIVAYMDIVQADDPGTSVPVYISPQV